MLEELCVMALKGVAKFKGKLTCSLENDIRNLVNFYASSQFVWKFALRSDPLPEPYKDLDKKV